jgi:hypothetical protein
MPVRKKLVASLDRLEPNIREMREDDTWKRVHNSGCGIIFVDEEDWMRYLKARAIVHEFEAKSVILAEADIAAALEYGDWP